MNFEKITLQVDGMSCGHCSGMVQKTLEEINGISDVSVDLEEKKASFRVNDKALIGTAVKEINQAGYTASMP